MSDIDLKFLEKIKENALMQNNKYLAATVNNTLIKMSETNEPTREEFINTHIQRHVRRKEEIIGLPIYKYDEDMRLEDTGEVVPNDIPDVLTQVSTNSGALSSRLEQTEPQYRALHIGPIDGGMAYVDKVPFLWYYII